MDVRLEASGLTLLRGPRQVLTGVSAGFAAGEISVVLGPNGAGKSTLLQALAGLLSPAEGRVLVEGAALSTLTPRARAQAIGFLPQAGAVHWNLAVRELVALGRIPHIGRFAGPSAKDRRAVDEALRAADLVALAGRPVGTLSGGERARALLARVLAGQPRVLLADEPLANLDPRHALDTLALFRRAAEGGAAVVLVLHDLNAAARVADRLLLLADGRCLAAGRRAYVLTPALLQQAYGLEMAVLDGPGGALMVIPR